MSGTGRPLRFLGLLVGGWIVLRLGATAAPLLWAPDRPGDSLPSARQASPMPSQQPVSMASAQVAPMLVARSAPVARHLNGTAPAKNAAPRLAAAFSEEPAIEAPPPRSVTGLAASQGFDTIGTTPRAADAVLTPGEPAAPYFSRWSLTGWLLWRRDAGASLAQAPLLGGSQGGVRLDYRLWRAGTRSLALYGRVTRALDRPFAEEAALGIALRPVEGLPVALLAERRQRLGDGARSGFAFLAAGGIGPKPVAARFDLEGYAQAGIVGLPGSEGFADGRLSLDYRLMRGGTPPDLALGLVLSGGAQSRASRLDIGPELRVRLPVARGHMRLSVEWRERIAGDARPAFRTGRDARRGFLKGGRRPALFLPHVFATTPSSWIFTCPSPISR